MEILKFNIYEKEANYTIELDGEEICIMLKFDLEENWEPTFNPGSFLGFGEKFSGMYPIDVEFSIDLPQEIQEEIENHLGENYDCR